jgi:hypothetical protein
MLSIMRTSFLTIAAIVVFTFFVSLQSCRDNNRVRIEPDGRIQSELRNGNSVNERSARIDRAEMATPRVTRVSSSECVTCNGLVKYERYLGVDYDASTVLDFEGENFTDRWKNVNVKDQNGRDISTYGLVTVVSWTNKLIRLRVGSTTNAVPMVLRVTFTNVDGVPFTYLIQVVPTVSGRVYESSSWFTNRRRVEMRLSAQPRRQDFASTGLINNYYYPVVGDIWLFANGTQQSVIESVTRRVTNSRLEEKYEVLTTEYVNGNRSSVSREIVYRNGGTPNSRFLVTDRNKAYDSANRKLQPAERFFR